MPHYAVPLSKPVRQNHMLLPIKRRIVKGFATAVDVFGIALSGSGATAFAVTYSLHLRLMGRFSRTFAIYRTASIDHR